MELIEYLTKHILVHPYVFSHIFINGKCIHPSMWRGKVIKNIYKGVGTSDIIKF